MTPKDKVRALLHKDATDRKDGVRIIIRKEAGIQSAKRGVGTLKDQIVSMLGQSLSTGTSMKPYTGGSGRLASIRAALKLNQKPIAATVATAGAGGAVGYGVGNTLTSSEGNTDLPAPTAAELSAAKGQTAAKKPTDGIPAEAMAGAGGAIAGGAAGYAAAPSLGIDRLTGAAGGAALSGIAAALLANRMKS